MQPVLLKGSNASYIFFPEEESTILSRNKFSVVYIAAHAVTKEKVICKHILPAFFNNQKARLKYFIEASVTLDHIGIAKTIDLIFAESQVFIVQEFVYGYSLKDLLNNREYLDYRYNNFFFKILAKTLDVLSYLHSNNITLYDLKPSNIMVIERDGNMDINNPEIKIIDIGGLRTSFKPLTLDSAGKPYSYIYASPEQVFGFDELVGEHSDIFTAGLILYEIIAKEPALKPANPVMLKRLQTVVKLEKHYRFDDETYFVISRATVKPEFTKSAAEATEDERKLAIVKSLGKRYQTAQDFKSDLLDLII
jgi:serine/threonine protein kinase